MEPEERSYGKRDDTSHTSLIDFTIMDPSEERSKTKAFWALGLEALKEEGWRVSYTDGSGRDGKVAGGVFSEDRRRGAGVGTKTYGCFLGEIASVTD